MIAKDLISYEIPSLSLSSSLEDALTVMDTNKCSHAVVVNDGVYVGLVGESAIWEIDDHKQIIGQAIKQFIKPAIDEKSHIYQVISLVNEFKISCVPVFNEGKEYLGVISLQNLAMNFAELTNVNEPGGILILEVKNRDYSLAQAAQIVESDNAKILSSYVYGNSDTLTLELVLKINKKDLSTIISAFDRYNYIIKDSYHESRFDEDMQGRYDQFMNYLNL
ncbi:MAG: acetoin utilization protein AcuB [Glaciecola sp.]